MAVTKIDVCNFALGLIGEQAILSLDDDTKTARVLKRIFEQTYKELLRSYPWSCATKRASLSRSTDTPAFEYDYKYILPSDFLKIIRINDVNADYVREGKYILTDETSVKLVYTAYIDDISELDPLFIQALYYKLAMAVIVPLNLDVDVKGVLLQEYTDIILPEAQNASTVEKSTVHRESFEYLDPYGEY